jgi:RNA polymerase sporulation-specific sigma factor
VVWSAEELSGLSDERLVTRARAGDDRALDVLLRRHTGLVRGIARTYFLPGADHDDLVQEGMIGLYRAIQEYDEARLARFASFARLCVERQLVTAVRLANRRKHRPLNDYVSLHRQSAGPGPGDAAPAAVLVCPPSADPVEQVLAAERLRHLRRHARSDLSALETDVLRLHLGGAGYRAIAGTLQRPAKTIDNALQRVRRKLDAALSAALSA